MKITALALLSLAVLALGAAPASAQLAIGAYTVDGGGGTSSGGSFAVTGTIGQPDAAPPATGGVFSLAGGFWPAAGTSSPSGYAAWAEANLPAGADHSFAGDANHDGIANGLHYAFGSTEVRVTGPGQSTAPAGPVPDDVELYWESSADLVDWLDVARWVGGQPGEPLLTEITLEDGIITNTLPTDNFGGFQRWRVVLVSP